MDLFSNYFQQVTGGPAAQDQVLLKKFNELRKGYKDPVTMDRLPPMACQDLDFVKGLVTGSFTPGNFYLLAQIVHLKNKNL